MSSEQLLAVVAWKPLFPMALAWEQAIQAAIQSLNDESLYVREMTDADPYAHLYLVAYPASTHDRLAGLSLVRHAFDAVPTSELSRFALVACDLSDPDVSETDVDDLLQTQSSNRIAHRHFNRSRTTEGLRTVAAEWMGATMVKLGVRAIPAESSLDQDLRNSFRRAI